MATNVRHGHLAHHIRYSLDREPYKVSIDPRALHYLPVVSLPRMHIIASLKIPVGPTNDSQTAQANLFVPLLVGINPSEPLILVPSTGAPVVTAPPAALGPISGAGLELTIG